MKNGFIHVCFIIDKSGSMYGSINDVKGGYASMIKEQKEQTQGSCAISLYQFDSTVKKEYIGKSIGEVNESLNYTPGGCTAMNDGIGTAIDEIGKWLNDMPEEERPEKNLIVIMTDGEENSSVEYSIQQIKDKIKEQTEKYNWTFIYMGTDITNADYSNDLGTISAFGSRRDSQKLYKSVSAMASSWRSMDADTDIITKNAVFFNTVNNMANDITADFEAESGININTNTKNFQNKD